MLFKYFDLTVEILAGHPKRFKILFTSFIPAPLAPLLSITIRRGMPLFDNAFAKNLVAAAVSRLADNMKSSVCPTARQALRSNAERGRGLQLGTNTSTRPAP